MDPLTHGLLGAALAQALCGRALGRRALAYGALAGMVPDADVVMSLRGPMGEFLHHRGTTHSLWFGPVVGPGLAWLAFRRGGLRGTLAAWIVLFVVGIVTHPLLDLCTSYGTQLLAPFSDRRFALHAVAIVDPAYSLILAVGLALGLWRGVSSRAAGAAAALALVLSTAYLAYGYSLNERLKERVRQDLRAESIPGSAALDVQAYPTLLQLSFRRVVAHVGDEVRVGWMRARQPEDRGEWDSFRPPDDPRIDAARRTPEGRILEWFAQGQVVGRVVDGGAAVELDDLRYGVPGRAELGFWGVRVPLDADGRPHGPATRFNRPLPDASGLLARLLREAWLN